MPKTISGANLVGLLANALGQDKATEVVAEAAKALGLQNADALSETDALRLLEQVSEQPGIVGITARFAKTHIHLQHKVDGGPRS